MRHLSLASFSFCVVISWAGTLCAAPGGVLAALKQSVPQLLVSTVNEQIQGKIESPKMEFSAPSTVILHNLKLTDTQGQTIVSIKKVVAELSLLSLLVGRIKVNSVSAEQPQVRLVSQGEVLNIERVFMSTAPSASSSRLPRIEINNISVNRGDFSWQGNQGDQITSRTVNGDADILIANNEFYLNCRSLNTKSGLVKIDQSEHLYENLQGQHISYGHEVLNVHQLSLNTRNTTLYAEGKVSWLHTDKPFVEAQVAFGAIDIFDVAFRKGLVNFTFSPSQLQIKKSNLVLQDGAIIEGSGRYQTLSKDLNLNADVKSLTLASLWRALDLNNDANASLSGQVQVSGSLKPNQALSIKSQTSVQNLNAYGVQARDQHTLDVDLDIIPQKHVRFNKLALKGKTLAGHLQGDVALGPSDFDLRLSIFLEQFNIANVPGQDVSFHLRASKRMIAMTDLKGSLAAGQLRGQISVLNTSKPAKLVGNIEIRNGQLEKVKIGALPFVPRGRVRSQIILSGTTDEPRIFADIKLSEVEAASLFFHSISAQSLFFKNKLSISALSGEMTRGRLSSSLIEADFDNQTLRGNIDVSDLELASLFKSRSINLSGLGSGRLKLSGKPLEPALEGAFALKQTTWDDILIGDGDLFVWLDTHNDTTVKISTALRSDKSMLLARAALNLNQNKIRAELVLDDVDIEPWTRRKSSPFMPLQGKLSGKANVYGLLSAPDVDANIKISELQFQDSSSQEESEAFEKHWTPVDDVWLHARRSKGILSATLKGLNNAKPWHLSMHGPFIGVDNYDLNIQGDLHLDNVENWVRAIHDELISGDVDLAISVNAKQKPKYEAPLLAGVLELKNLRLALPGVPGIKLKESASLKFDNSHVKLLSPAVLQFPNGELVLKGDLGKTHFNIDAKGRIPLLFAKFFTSHVVWAQGLATGEMQLRGTPKHPIVRVSIAPDVGASFKLPQYLDEIVFQEGQFSFTSTKKRDAFMLQLDHLKLIIGDGKAYLNGNAQLDFSNAAQDASTQFNLELKGESIVLKSDNDWIDSDLDLTLRTEGNEQWLRGKLNVSDGHFFKKFTLSNFILSSSSSTMPKIPKSFLSTNLDVKIQAQSFHAEAEMGAFLLDSYLSADLHLIGSASHPRLIGGMEIADGSLKFPTLTFEIPTTPIPFRNTPTRFIDPQINLYAFAELPQKRFGLKEDTTVELSLVGDLNQLRFDMRPLYGDKSLDRTKLLLSLVGSSKFGSELVEKALSSYTNTRILIGSSIQSEGVATQMQWQLSPRLELEGTTNTSSQRVGLQDIKLRFMIFDHLPIGRELFFEGIFLSPASENLNLKKNDQLRLKFRIVEK
jgi:hypothetical protein